jgi:hypothetical protein
VTFDDDCTSTPVEPEAVLPSPGRRVRRRRVVGTDTPVAVTAGESAAPVTVTVVAPLVPPATKLWS